MVTIASPAARAVRGAIADLDGVTRVMLFGDGVHAVIDDPARRIPELRRALEVAGVAFAGITPTQPSIEDVFVALLTEQGKSP